MDVRALVVGLAVGAAGGAGLAWCAGGGRPCNDRGAPSGAGPTPAPNPGARLEGAASPRRQTETPPAPTALERALASGDLEAVQRARQAHAVAPPPSAGEVTAAAALLERAVAAKDSRALDAAVAVLEAAPGDPRALEALAALVGRDDVPSDRLRARALAAALRDARVPGLASAARRRFERNLAAGETSWVAADGWLDMVARHGSADDVAWVAERSESSQIRTQALEALASARNPEALRFAWDAVRAGRDSERLLGLLLEASPEAGLRLLEEHWQALRGDPPTTGSPGARDVLTLWARHAPREDAPRLLRQVTRDGAERERIDAVYALGVLKERGLDLGEFESLLLAPVVALEARSAPREDGQSDAVGVAAAYAIEANRVTWSERAARALENAQGVSGGSDRKQVAAMVRAGLTDSGWR